MNINDGQFVGHPVISVRCVRRLLFMAERNVLDTQSMTRINESVIRVTALPENFSDTFLLQALRYKHRAVHVFIAPLRQADCDQSFFGHLLNRVSRPFAAKPAVLDSAKWHKVDPAAG